MLSKSFQGLSGEEGEEQKEELDLYNLPPQFLSVYSVRGCGRKVHVFVMIHGLSHSIHSVLGTNGSCSSSRPFLNSSAFGFHLFGEYLFHFGRDLKRRRKVLQYFSIFYFLYYFQREQGKHGSRHISLAQCKLI